MHTHDIFEHTQMAYLIIVTFLQQDHRIPHLASPETSHDLDILKKPITKYQLLRGMSTQNKIPFIFAHITSYQIFLKFGTVGQPSINSEMYRIKNRLVAKF